MRRMWPDEFNHLLDDAEEVTLEIPPAVHEDVSHGGTTFRQALKVRLSEQDYERIWPLAETRYRLAGERTGKAITLIVNNPHYLRWHPADGGVSDITTDSGRHYTTKYLVVHFLLDDVREAVPA